jgi:cytochrome b
MKEYVSSVAQAASGPATTAVWDPFVRLCHWSLAAIFLLDHFVTDEGRAIHNWLGYVAMGLIAMRVVWGFVSSNPRARFSDFVPSPRAFLAHMRDMARSRDHRHIGHNPAGGAMMVILLGLMAGLGLTGWMQTTDAYWGVEWVQDTHAWLSQIVLWLVLAHVAGALYQSWRFRENLVLAMFTGRKRP